MSKKMIALFLTCIMACTIFVVSAYAATNSFSGNTGTMNSMNGAQSSQWPVICPTSYASSIVTGVTLNVSVSNGSSQFVLTVVDPLGHKATRNISGSGTQKFTEFNNYNPNGKWNIYITTTGVVSTATASMTVNYSY